MSYDRNNLKEDRNCVVVFFGMVASGKSYLAKAWAAKRQAVYCNSDVIRKEIAGLLPESRQHEPIGQGIYSSEFSRKTYDVMIEKAQSACLGNGDNIVVLDGSYQNQEERNRLLESLQGRCRVVFIYCYCTEKVTIERLAIRDADSHAVSDGRLLIYRYQQDHFQLPNELGDEQLLQLDTNASLTDLIGKVDEKIGELTKRLV